MYIVQYTVQYTVRVQYNVQYNTTHCKAVIRPIQLQGLLYTHKPPPVAA